MRNDDSGPLLRFNCDCMRLSCPRDFSTEPRKRSTSLRTCSGRSFKLNETKSGSKLRRALPMAAPTEATTRSEEHTSELQSRLHLVCRLLLEKKKKKKKPQKRPASTRRVIH